MRRTFAALAVAACAITAAPSGVAAHATPVSYLEARLGGHDELTLSVVADVADLGRELGVEPAVLLEQGEVTRLAPALDALLAARLRVTVDGVRLAITPARPPRALPEQRAVEVTVGGRASRPPGLVNVELALRPDDRAHQTLVTFREPDARGGERVAQAILDSRHARAEYVVGGVRGLAVVARRFLPAGVAHVLGGADHLLFLAGLLLLGGSWRRLLLVVGAFTVGHSVTLALATLDLVRAPAALIEAAIALSCICVAVDNLLARGGWDVRPWIALAFGVIHGFGFARVLAPEAVPPGALLGALGAFNLGVELGQLAFVVPVAAVLALARAHRPALAGRVAVGGSVAVALAGTVWFAQRLATLARGA